MLKFSSSPKNCKGLSIMASTFSLKRSYLVLILLAIFFSALSSYLFFAYKEQWFSAYSTSIASGIVGSLIVIFLIDRIIERNREREQMQMRKIALEKLRIPIVWQMMLLCNVYKAASKDKPQKLPSNFQEIFTDNFYTEVSFLDFAKDAGVTPKTDWFNRLDSELRFFKKKIEQTIDTYAIFCDSSFISLLEKLINSHFTFFIIQAKAIPIVDMQMGFKRRYTMFSGTEEFLKEHALLMLQLIDYFNSEAEKPIEFDTSIWRDDVSPLWGSGRVQG